MNEYQLAARMAQVDTEYHKKSECPYTTTCIHYREHFSVNKDMCTGASHGSCSTFNFLESKLEKMTE